ncbi:MAG: peptide chain release factor-like protein [Lentisphaerae bacterium]|nr:peptide chain release factor-like protein [Lentisphaerota bacterium]
MAAAGVAEADLEEKFVLGSGSGGQKVNKTASAVMLRHKPSQMVVKCQTTRSRESNRWLARRRLAEKILETVEGEKSARQQAVEKIKRQKRRRSRKQKERMLAEKRERSEKKEGRRPVDMPW